MIDELFEEKGIKMTFEVLKKTTFRRDEENSSIVHIDYEDDKGIKNYLGSFQIERMETFNLPECYPFTQYSLGESA